MIVLGINHSAYHDSSAAIVRDGIPLFAIAEERLSKVKHDAAFPTLAIKACLDHVGITITEIDQIVLGWQPYGQIIKRTVSNVLSRKEPMPLKSLPGYVARNTLADYQRSSERMMRRHFGGKFVAPRRIDHHYAHALSAYVPSGMEEATVVVIDGRGAWEASSIWHGKGNRLDHVETVKWPNSLGLFYATFTGFLGFEKYADEWKVMGLAPYGTPGAVDLSPFVSYANGQYQVRSDLLMLHEGGREYAGVERFLGPARNPDAELTQADRDLAWAVQDMCERVECDFITKAIERTGCRNLCIAGGVGLNSKANGLFLQKRLCDEIFVQPAAGDDGVALGAALAPSFEGAYVR